MAKMKYAIDYDRKLAAKVRKAIRAGLEVVCVRMGTADGSAEWDVLAKRPYQSDTPVDYGTLLGVTTDERLAREWESMSRCYGTDAQFGL